jgi:TPP-dependent indolepyruvate ferredoxin oxidoreductase alpha subunit
MTGSVSAFHRPGRPIAPFALAAPWRPPLAIAVARCNRCGSCLAVGCPAIADSGGEALAIDPAACSGCGICAPRCRARAIGPALRRPG